MTLVSLKLFSQSEIFQRLFIFVSAPHSRRWAMKKQINLDHFWQLMTYEDLSDLRLFNLKLLNV